MIGPSLILAAAGLLGVDVRVAAELVSKLGSGRYSEREAAARGLEALGASALPSLRTARVARDPEVRQRAAALVDRIEASLLLRPTEVDLGTRDRPLSEVVADLGRQSGMPIVLDAADPTLIDRRVRVGPAGPVAYWAAIDRVCESAGLRTWPGPQGGDAPGLLLVAAPPGAPSAVASTSGLFRTRLMKLDHHRTRRFETPPGVVAAPEGEESFFAEIQVLAEPRLVVRQAGPIRVDVALDDADRPLTLPVGDMPFEAVESISERSVDLTIALANPAPSVRSIRRLRGSVPMAVATRRVEPTTVRLDEARGRPVDVPGASITVVAVVAEPAGPQATVELLVRPRMGAEPRPGADAPAPASAPVGPGFGDFLAHRFEVLDPRGRPLLAFPTQEAQPDGSIRLVLILAADEDAGRPTSIRCHDLSTGRADAKFDFTDIRW